jgi:hypothetical protein
MSDGARVEATRPLLRRPLAVGRADDPLEREAEAVADRVLRMPDPGPALAGERPTASQPQTPTGKQPAGEEPEEPYPFPSKPIGIGVAPVDEEEGDGVAQRRPAGAGACWPTSWRTCCSRPR